VLAKLLLQEADFYLFDEPTNHLDLMAKEWFLGFLKTTTSGFMLVCHERYFLDELCTDILELERGIGTLYKGNYSTYVIQKEEALERLESAYHLQQKDIQRKKETIARFKASASKAKMAQSMMKALDKIELITLPPSPKNVHFSFPPTQQAGRTVLTVKNVSYAFGSKQLFTHVSCEIERGQKVALIAPNGAGKTTLFNLITGALPLQHGTITFGYNVQHAIFAQDQNKSLNLQDTVIDNIRHLCPKMTDQTIRTFLGSFLFSSDDVHKKVGVLSGGEKNRVGMVSVLLQGANMLLLDEPTNHLDIPSKEILLKALQEYSGTILFVSHDRDFVNALASHVLELTANGAHTYHGNYDAYVYQKKSNTPVDAQATTKAHQPQQSEKNGAESYELNKKISRIEEKLEKLTLQRGTLEESFANLVYGTSEYLAAQQKLKRTHKEIAELEAQWEEMMRGKF
jgi:ATP-binding cassette, subfamily F, member 3